MNQLDLFYWAFEQYKKEFIDNRDTYLFHKGVNSKKAPHDYTSMIEVTCEIEEDWIAAIEKGLDYIAKAIKEDRQFIRNEGEVLPIEKIRRVSKDSITDLSKHSNYITRLPKEAEDPVVPEKLLMIKRENDYSIYENRVVYTTLSYLKDFVSTRLEKIKELVNKYDGKLIIKKNIELGYRTVDVLIDIHDVRKNDEIAMRRAKCQDKIQRLDAILNGVLVLLKTPLMQEVSKAPLVTRPVTKTNVLKMNTNFKESLYIFDYVCAYNKPGYTISETEKKISPLSIEQEDNYTEVILLSSFLTYAINNGLEEQLKANYLAEVKRREVLHDEEILNRIKELMGKAKKSEKSIGEYLLMLEEGYHILEKRIQEGKEELEKTIADYEAKIVEINEQHEQEIAELNEKHENEINELNEKHETEINELNEKHDQFVEELNSKHDQELEDLRTSLENKYSETITKQEAEITRLSLDNTKLSAEHAAMKAELEKTQKECAARVERLLKEIELAHAENLALRIAKRKPVVDPRDFTSKARFNQLEYELKILNEFFELAWKETRKAIKKKHYSQITK